MNKKNQVTDSKVGRNRLANASSPYLLAHADNPVDWYEWGDEAFARAKTEDKPIFLSIGYNACHWCHVMEHESFKNEEIAALLNEYFVSIKVDREERPDIDQIYMTAVQTMTGGGGWPMSVFMTPDKKPFYAGTYFPPETMAGRPGFKFVITELAAAYKESRDKIFSSADAIVDQIASVSSATIAARPIDKNVLVSAAKTIYADFDSRHGGFGGAPKFPQAANLSLMFRAYHLSGDKKYLEAALFTLRKMAEGGIYDQLGGGFHRYSTDQQWLVPHFEKMLYDNALLVIPYLEAYQLTGDDFYLSIVHGILNYLQSEMTDPDGGIYSTQDADSEGEEGKYYVWQSEEIDNLLGPDAEIFTHYFGVTESGNFEHEKNILNLGPHSEKAREWSELAEDDFDKKIEILKQKLLGFRRKRIPPATDDKILASWNGLAISAFAQAYQVTGTPSYRTSAERAADFVLRQMSDGDNLYHSFRKGALLKIELLEDYAYFIAGLIDLYQITFDESYLNKAVQLGRRAVDQFLQDDIFYATPHTDTDLIFRPRDLTDGATPSSASIMIQNLLRLAAITGDEQLAQKGRSALIAVSGLASRIPQATASLLIAGHFDMSDPVEIVIVGNDRQKFNEFNRAVFSKYIPNKIVVGSNGLKKSDLPLLIGRQHVEELTYYFCVNKTCHLPVTDIKRLQEELNRVITSTATP